MQAERDKCHQRKIFSILTASTFVLLSFDSQYGERQVREPHFDWRDPGSNPCLALQLTDLSWDCHCRLTYPTFSVRIKRQLHTHTHTPEMFAALSLLKESCINKSIFYSSVHVNELPPHHTPWNLHRKTSPLSITNRFVYFFIYKLLAKFICYRKRHAAATSTTIIVCFTFSWLQNEKINIPCIRAIWAKWRQLCTDF